MADCPNQNNAVQRDHDLGDLTLDVQTQESGLDQCSLGSTLSKADIERELPADSAHAPQPREPVQTENNRDRTQRSTAEVSFEGLEQPIASAVSPSPDRLSSQPTHTEPHQDPSREVTTRDARPSRPGLDAIHVAVPRSAHPQTILDRLVTFIAKLLKAFEQFALGLLARRKNEPSPDDRFEEHLLLTSENSKLNRIRMEERLRLEKEALEKEIFDKNTEEHALRYQRPTGSDTD